MTVTEVKKVSTKTKMTKELNNNLGNTFDIANLTAKDIKAHPIKDDEIRNAIEIYYDMQDIRIRSGNRKNALIREETKKIKAMAKETNQSIDDFEVEVPLYLQYIEDKFKETENTITKFLTYYAKSNPIGNWLLSITGIGPVIAAGLLSYIDIKKCETAGSIWQYAGWDGSRKMRRKGEKITWNPKFRILCWKIGESFVKNSSRESDIYGHLYLEKKKWYEEKNESGGFSEKAKEELKYKNYDKNSEAYKCYSNGKLPQSHINAMAKRFAVKIFLSHLFELWYEYDRGVKAPKPFVQEHLGHVHIIKAPNRNIIFPNE